MRAKSLVNRPSGWFPAYPPHFTALYVEWLRLGGVLAVAEFRGDGEPEPFLFVSAPVLGRMSIGARKRLASLALGEWRRRRLPVRGRTGALVAYFALGAPGDRLCAWGRGLVDRRGRGVAVLVGSQRTLSSVRAVGDPRVEEEVLRLVREWDERGRPGLEQLRLRVSYGKRSTRAWRWSKRAESIVAFDWATEDR